MSRTATETHVFGARVQAFFNDTWYGRSRWFVALLPLSWLFRIGVFLRRAAYRRGAIPRFRLTVPVIVVGNITVGGTGKTPLVAWLARELTHRGRRPGIISRGYGASPSVAPRIVAPNSPAAEVGDEPVELRRKTGVPVCVCADRVRAGHALIAQGVDVLIADDGLQHYRLGRDLEIAVLDGGRLLGNGRLLPAGPLREPMARLEEADVVLVNGDAAFPDALNFCLVPKSVEPLAGGYRVDLRHFSGQRVWSVAGIANPGRFVDMLEAAGIEAVMAAVPDHGMIRLDVLREKEAMPILMTEKDAVKYSDTSANDVWFVSVDIKMPDATCAALSAAIDGVLH